MPAYKKEADIMMKEEIIQFVETHSSEWADCAAAIHRYAEPSGEEYRSAAQLENLLEAHGFRVERGLKDLPTAFRAVYGNGPVRIGFMCEYDALATLQQNDVPYRQGDGGFGHGCGHNLLGTGSAAAGIALKKMIDLHQLPATVVVYGTPAEETLAGKTIMVNNGYFRDVDVVLGWHPHNHNDPGEIKHKAADAFTMTFRGRAAHACNCPENGRSALDAAELTNVGVNYLREHVSRDCYMHYCYLNGGERPNIVPDYAKLWYMVRAYRYASMQELKQRVMRIAEGACMMTDTAVEFEDLGSTHDNRLNFTLAKLAHDTMLEVGIPKFPKEEVEYAAKIAENMQVPGFTGEFDEQVMDADHTIKIDLGSTDLSDVSQVVPTVNMFTACFAKNTPMHSWAVTAQACRPSAQRGMRFASQTLACMAVKLITQPELLATVRAEFEQGEGE